jgi:recombination protein RecR
MADVLPGPLTTLVAELRRLPGVGDKTATRYVLGLLGRSPDGPEALAAALRAVATRVRPCAVCGFVADGDTCAFCLDPARDGDTICVVEGIADLLAIEKVGEFRGRYHVLGGSLSALRGITPDRLRLRQLRERVAAGGVREIIVATGADAEGETTALYVRKVLEEFPVRVTRPATGIPMGSSIEYLDAVTLMRAMRGRRDL